MKKKNFGYSLISFLILLSNVSHGQFGGMLMTIDLNVLLN